MTWRQVDAFLLMLGLCPQERWIRSPNLNTTGVLRLRDMQVLCRRCDPVFSSVAGFPDTHDRIADPPHTVLEVLSAASAEVPSVGMHAEPVLIQMWPAAIGAGDKAHRKAEHRTDHVIDRVVFGDDD